MTKLDLTITRPQCWTIAVSRTAPLGLTLTQAAASNIVTAIQPGVIADWNKSHPDKEVKVGDRIVAVNGNKAVGKEQMELVKKDGTLQIVVSRKGPSGVMDSFWEWFN